MLCNGNRGFDFSFLPFLPFPPYNIYVYREFSSFPGALPYFSERISQAINMARDAIAEGLDHTHLEDDLFRELLPLFHHHLPPTVAKLGFDHVMESVPLQYIENAFASCLASHIVYHEVIE